ILEEVSAESEQRAELADEDVAGRYLAVRAPFFVPIHNQDGANVAQHHRAVPSDNALHNAVVVDPDVIAELLVGRAFVRLIGLHKALHRPYGSAPRRLAALGPEQHVRLVALALEGDLLA